MDTKEFRSIVAWLRKTFPVSMPVVVRRSKSKKNHGVTRFDGGRFLVRINSRFERAVQIETMLHEWGHVVAMDNAYSHGDYWSQIYGKIYTAWETQ